MTTQVDHPVRRSRRIAVLVATAVIAVAGGGALLATDLFAGSRPAQSLELQLPDAGGAASMCIQFSVDDLARMTPAFAGTVTALTDDGAVLRVDRWYTGGDATEVRVRVPDDAHIALNGTIDFQQGRQYLITAADGMVNLCGYSGEATPELEAAFEAAF